MDRKSPHVCACGCANDGFCAFVCVFKSQIILNKFGLKCGAAGINQNDKKGAVKWDQRVLFDYMRREADNCCCL